MKRKFLKCFTISLAVLCFSLVFSFFNAINDVSADSGKIATIVGDFSRIRLVENNEIMGNLRTGTKLNIVSEDSQWVYYYYDGQYCKTHKSLVTVSEGSVSSNPSSSNKKTSSSKAKTTKSKDEAYYAFGKVTLEKGNTVNVREGASTRTTKLGTLPEDAFVFIIAQNGDFYKVYYNDKEAYIQKPYITAYSGIELPPNSCINVSNHDYYNTTSITIVYDINIETGSVTLKQK